jgi:hypothetical protein
VEFSAIVNTQSLVIDSSGAGQEVLRSVDNWVYTYDVNATQRKIADAMTTAERSNNLPFLEMTKEVQAVRLGDMGMVIERRNSPSLGALFNYSTTTYFPGMNHLFSGGVVQTENGLGSTDILPRSEFERYVVKVPPLARPEAVASKTTAETPVPAPEGTFEPATLAPTQPTKPAEATSEALPAPVPPAGEDNPRTSSDIRTDIDKKMQIPVAPESALDIRPPAVTEIGLPASPSPRSLGKLTPAVSPGEEVTLATIGRDLAALGYDRQPAYEMQWPITQRIDIAEVNRIRRDLATGALSSAQAARQLQEKVISQVKSKDVSDGQLWDLSRSLNTGKFVCDTSSQLLHVLGRAIGLDMAYAQAFTAHTETVHTGLLGVFRIGNREYKWAQNHAVVLLRTGGGEITVFDPINNYISGPFSVNSLDKFDLDNKTFAILPGAEGERLTKAVQLSGPINVIPEDAQSLEGKRFSTAASAVNSVTVPGRAAVIANALIQAAMGAGERTGIIGRLAQPSHPMEVGELYRKDILDGTHWLVYNNGTKKLFDAKGRMLKKGTVGATEESFREYSRALAESRGYKVVIVSSQRQWEDAFGKEHIQKAGTPAGLSDPQVRTIYLSVNRNRITPETFAHELTHALSDSLGGDDQQIQQAASATTGEMQTLIQDYYKGILNYRPDEAFSGLPTSYRKTPSGGKITGIMEPGSEFPAWIYGKLIAHEYGRTYYSSNSLHPIVEKITRLLDRDSQGGQQYRAFGQSLAQYYRKLGLYVPTTLRRYEK